MGAFSPDTFWGRLGAAVSCCRICQTLCGCGWAAKSALLCIGRGTIALRGGIFIVDWAPPNLNYTPLMRSDPPAAARSADLAAPQPGVWRSTTRQSPLSFWGAKLGCVFERRPEPLGHVEHLPRSVASLEPPRQFEKGIAGRSTSRSRHFLVATARFSALTYARGKR